MTTGTAMQNVPPVPHAKTADLQGERGNSGDGGNRTRAPFPPSADCDSPCKSRETCTVGLAAPCDLARPDRPMEALR